MAAADLMAWQGVLLAVVLVPVVAGVVVVLVRQYVRLVEARATLARDRSYRELAEAAVAAQRQHATEVAALTAAVADLKGSLAKVERLLREVG